MPIFVFAIYRETDLICANVRFHASTHAEASTAFREALGADGLLVSGNGRDGSDGDDQDALDAFSITVNVKATDVARIVDTEPCDRDECWFCTPAEPFTIGERITDTSSRRATAHVLKGLSTLDWHEPGTMLMATCGIPIPIATARAASEDDRICGSCRPVVAPPLLNAALMEPQ